MAIFTKGKPGWQHRDPEVRLAAINDPAGVPTAYLALLVAEDPEERVRLAAAARLDDTKVIRELLANDISGAPADFLARRLDQLYCESLCRENVSEEWPEMVEAIRGESSLVAICHGPGPVALRLAAARRVREGKNLAAIASGPCGREVGEEVISRIDDRSLLAGLVDSAGSRHLRRLAGERISSDHDAEEGDKDRGKDLLARAGELIDPVDWDQAREEMDRLKARAVDLAPEEAEAFARLKGEFSERYAAIEKKRGEQAAKAEANSRCLAAYDEICRSIEELCGLNDVNDESDPAGRYAALVDRWMTIREDPATPLAPTAALERRFRKARKEWQEREKILREVEKKVASWREKLARIKASEDPLQGLSLVAALKDEFVDSSLKGGEVAKLKEEVAAVIARFEELSGQVLKAREEREKVALSSRRRICEEIERLAKDIPGAKGANRVKALRDQWHAIPHGGGDRELEQRYHQALEQFHACHQEFIHEQEWRLWANFTIKERLTREAEGLGVAEDLAVVYDSIRGLQRQWKEVGAVPRRESERLWQRFHQACEGNFERCRPFLARRSEERKKIREEHRGFLARATELAESSDFTAAAGELKGMQAKWKEDGIGVDRQDFKTYKEFRRVCNKFFARRHQDFESREQEREKNLEAKIALCEEAEKLAGEPDWNLSRHFSDLQKEWKKIGPVPKSHDPEIWERFRAACNRYFFWLDQRRLENQEAKEALLARVVTLDRETDRRAACAAVREIQEQWKKIGPVPRERSEGLYEEFRAACERVFTARNLEREENGERKRELCYRAEEIAGGEGSEKEIGEELKKIQEEWKEIGPAPPAVEKELFHRLKETCDGFFAGRRKQLEDIRADRVESLKQKEALCLRLENLAGTSSEKSLAETDSAALAVALQQAMQGNAIGVSGDSNRRTAREVKKIQQQWQALGPVERKDEQRLNRRYRKAMEAFKRKKNP